MLSKIRSEQLRPGMYLHKLCGSWMQHPFWRTSFIIRDDAQIALIIDSGIEEVWIDVVKGDAPDGPAATDDAVDDIADETVAAEQPPACDPPESPAPAEPTPPPAAVAQLPTAFEDEIAAAKRICATGKPVIMAMFREARMGNAIDSAAARAMVEDIANSVSRNASALISVARLKTADDYTFFHSIAVCALMVALARQLGMDSTRQRQAGLGGLLHDIGKSQVPLELLNKPGALSDAEFEIVRRHPLQGHRLLLEAGFTDDDVLDVVLHHHERADGSGYPHRLDAAATGELARMGAICDVYDAITSNRPYKEGWDPAQSIHRMHSWKGHFDPPLLQHFVRSIGIYPVGALVRLESDKLGVVCEPGKGSLLKPKVKAFYSARIRKQISVHEIDLASPGCDDRIIGVEAPATWGFKNLETLWMP